MKKIILPENSTSLTEEEIKHIEGGANSFNIPEIMNDIFAMTMNRIVTLIGYAIFDPIDIINRYIRNAISPYTSSSTPIETNIADNQLNDRS